MASMTPSSDDPELRKTFPIERRPLMMLKDYLRDDLSSCSSNGFRSYPRRQCCTTVRYLLEVDLKTRDSKLLMRTKSISALQRASEAVINAVKHLPFTSVKSPSSSVQNRAKRGILLPRSLSRKLLRRSFWKKTDKEDLEIERWTSFRDLIGEKHEPLDSSSSSLTCTVTTTSTTTTASTSTNSWSDSEFTSDYLRCSSGNSESSGENDAVESKKQLPEKKVSKRVGVAVVGEDSMEAVGTTTTCSAEKAEKELPNEEKEQFSPVSVLDCPFEDEEEECSPFQCSLARMEGTKQKLMQKIRRFESLAQLEPVDLEKRIAMSESDDESLESPMQSCSMSIQDNSMFDENEEVMGAAQQKAEELLKLIKATIPSLDSYKFKADNLLLDFFRESILERYVNSDAITRGNKFDYELLKVAEDWMNGYRGELSLEWEVQDNRKAYIRDMEELGRWRKLEEEKEEVAVEVEVEVLTSLVNELLLDLFSS